MRLTTYHGVLSLLALLAGQQGALAQRSIDCEQSRTPIERAVCADPDLLQIDREVENQYLETLGWANELGSSPATEVQARFQWFKVRDGCEKSEGDAERLTCLRAAYASRRQTLEERRAHFAAERQRLTPEAQDLAEHSEREVGANPRRPDSTAEPSRSLGTDSAALHGDAGSGSAALPFGPEHDPAMIFAITVMAVGVLLILRGARTALKKRNDPFEQFLARQKAEREACEALAAARKAKRDSLLHELNEQRRKFLDAVGQSSTTRYQGVTVVAARGQVTGRVRGTHDVKYFDEREYKAASRAHKQEQKLAEHHYQLEKAAVSRIRIEEERLRMAKKRELRRQGVGLIGASILAPVKHHAEPHKPDVGDAPSRTEYTEVAEEPFCCEAAAVSLHHLFAVAASSDFSASSAQLWDDLMTLAARADYDLLQSLPRYPGRLHVSPDALLAPYQRELEVALSDAASHGRLRVRDVEVEDLQFNRWTDACEIDVKKLSDPQFRAEVVEPLIANLKELGEMSADE